MTIINEHDEVRAVYAHLRAETVRHIQPEIVILDIGMDTRMSLSYAAELGFPIAVKDDPVEVGFGWRALGIPTVRLGGIEADVFGGAGRIIGVGDGLDGAGVGEGGGDAPGNLLAGHIGQLLIVTVAGMVALPGRELVRVANSFSKCEKTALLQSQGISFAKNCELCLGTNPAKAN